MEQKRPQQTDQQATNAALAALAAAGNAFALGQLWEVNKGFIRRQLWQWYEKNKPIADNAGLSFDDLVQEGYFAVDYAAKHYSAEQGSFTTYLSYALHSQIGKATCGEHKRSVTTEDGRRVAVSANPLNNCTSLDAPLDSDDDGSSTRGDLIEDPAASQAFQQAEETIYNHELHDALEKALSKVPEREADVLRHRYYDGKSLRAIGEELGVTRSRVQEIERRGIRRLQHDSPLQRWRDEIISARAWRGTGYGAWFYGGSVEERAVEYLEEREKAQLDYYAWRDQMIREHYADFEATGYFDRHPEQRPNLESRTNPEESTPPGEV